MQKDTGKCVEKCSDDEVPYKNTTTNISVCNKCLEGFKQKINQTDNSSYCGPICEPNEFLMVNKKCLKCNVSFGEGCMRCNPWTCLQCKTDQFF